MMPIESITEGQILVTEGQPRVHGVCRMPPIGINGTWGHPGRPERLRTLTRQYAIHTINV